MHTHLIKNAKLWLESKAIEQLGYVSQLPGVITAVGMPDLHPGRNAPVGMAFATKNLIYPSLIGPDIGCGYACFLVSGVTNFEKLAKKARFFDPVDYQSKFLVPEAAPWTEQFCTLGLGNHFIEIGQCVSGPYKGQYILTIHCGSRNYGMQVLQATLAKAHEAGLTAESAIGQDYLKNHNYAVEWAKLNRIALAKALAFHLNLELELLCNTVHNYVELTEINKVPIAIHRKGCNNAYGLNFIAGSRGTSSYLVEPINTLSSLHSLPHGCGRKYNRGEMQSRGRDLLEGSDKSRLGATHIICNKKDLLYEEHPFAYKSIDQIMTCLEEHKLIKSELSSEIEPRLNYKTIEG